MSFTSTGVLQPSGLAQEAFLHSSELCSSPQFNIRWANAELRIADLLSRIQPNGLSELRRKVVADYVSGLIHKCLDCEVFKFGSVPLKTYLPDGDIDLTAFSHHRELRDTWASDVQTVLEHEEQRKDAECRVSKVQCIHAEVKIVKCVVEDIVVDISFNQLGGLCTLCFLEEVDRLIEKNHLFKRSILLVKAWCYYESRILGAHHGLISTYALETLVLYIFNVFHSNLRGPLEVLFTFLDYFSKFDWERYCVSLWGPVPLTSLPDLTVEPPLKDGGKLLLSKDFLESCGALYDVFPKGQDTQARTFGGKFLNIVDPLRTNNNLGRSVSQANSYRIRSAFDLGARKLAKVFEANDDDFHKYLDEFFSNTWERHQNGGRPDAPTSNFPLQQMLVYKAGILDTHHSSDQANDVLGMPQFVKSAVPSREEIINDSKALSSHSPLNTVLRDVNTETTGQKPDRNVCFHSSNSFKGILESHVIQSTSTCDMPFAVSTDSQLKTSSLRTISSGPSMSSKQRPEFPAALKRTISEGRIEKNLNADAVKNRNLPEYVQDINVLQRTSEYDRKEVWKSACSPLEAQQGKEMPGPPKTSSGHSELKRSESCRNWLTLDSCESASNAATNDMPMVCTSFTLKSSTERDAVPQKPPGFLFPESRDLLYAPQAPFSLPSFSSSSSLSVLSPSPFCDPASSPDLDTWKTKTARVNTTAVSVMTPIENSGVQPSSSNEGMQSTARATRLHNGVNALQTHIKQLSFKEMEQQLNFWQQSEQGPPPSFKPFQPWSHSSEVLPVSQVVNLERNHADPSAPNARLITMEKASNRTREAVSLHTEDLAETAEADDTMQPQRREFLDAEILPRKKGDLYGGSEGASNAFPALASEVKMNVGSDISDPSVKRASGSSGFDGHNLPDSMPYFCQPSPTYVPGLEKVAFPVPDAAQRPSVYLDSSESHPFGTPAATGSLVKEGDNQLAEGAPTLYLPIGAFPTVSYYNPFYSVLPTNHEFRDCRVNNSGSHVQHGDNIGHFVGSEPEESSSQPFYAPGQRLNSTTAAAISARFASLSAEGGKKEPPRDLLKSDLANHLRNLEFGRWCQEPLSQPYLDSPSLYHSSQGPALWGFSPFTPLPGITRPFNHSFGDVNGLVPVPLSPQNFGNMPHNFPWSGAENSGPHKQKTGTEAVLPLREMYRDMESLSPQIAAQFDQRTSPGKQGDMNTWRMAHISTMDHSSAIPASVAPPSHYGACNGATGLNAFGSSVSEHGAINTCLPDQFPGRVFPLVARQLEFGSLGPIEIMSFSDDDVGTRQFNKYSTGDTSSNSFSPLFVRDKSNTPQS